MAVGPTVRVTRTSHINLNALVEKIKEAHARVLVGIPMGVTESNGDSIAVIAAKNEFGSSFEYIPERPFLRIGVANSKEQYSKLMAREMPALLRGEIPLDDVFNMLGAMAAGSVKKQIRNGTYKKNSPTTIALKGSSKPLIDTGTMIQSITWVIEKDGRYA